MRINFLLPGAKTRLREELVSLFPKTGRRYGEACAGRGNVFWHAGKELMFQEWYLNDLVTAKWFGDLKTVASMDSHTLPYTMNRQVFEEVRDGVYGDAVRSVLEPEITAYGIGYVRSAFISGCDKKYNPTKIHNRISAAAAMLKGRNVRLSGLEFHRLNWWETWTADDFIYVDPPYYGAPATAYPDIDHYKLMECLKSTKARWALSNYDNNFYRKHLGEPFMTFEVNASMAEWRIMWGADTGRGNKRQEAIWLRP